MPRGQAIRRRLQETPQEKGQKQEHCKSKNQHRFPSRIGGGWSAEIAAFLLSSNIKIRRAKKFSRAEKKYIFQAWKMDSSYWSTLGVQLT
jgi:hypothetical protein